MSYLLHIYILDGHQTPIYLVDKHNM